MSVGMGPQSWKQCPRCGAANHLDAQACACGHQFSTRFVANQTTAFNAAIQAPPVQQQPPVTVNYLDQSQNVYFVNAEPVNTAAPGCGEYILCFILGAIGVFPCFTPFVAGFFFWQAKQFDQSAIQDPYNAAIYHRRASGATFAAVSFLCLTIAYAYAFIVQPKT